MKEQITYDPLLSTHENLKLNGLTTRDTPIAGKKEVLDQQGMMVLGPKTAYEVTDWLSSQANQTITHDGGPDRIDGAPSDGDII
jgi:hypothetical protein